MTRTLGFVTSARSDFGLLRPVIAAALEDPGFAVAVYATGMHFSRRHGHTVDEILDAGLGPWLVPIDSTPADDSAAGLAEAMARSVAGFGRQFAAAPPDLLVVLGDRYDMVPAVVAALPFTLPIAHLAGGELTQGVIDDAIRHAVTKLSHLHFPSLPAYAERLLRMGEEPWRITVTGLPGLDVIGTLRFGTREAVLGELGLDPAQPVTVLTVHPETLAPERTGALIEAILAAAVTAGSQLVITYPNADTSADVIIAAIKAFAACAPRCRLVPHLGHHRYLNLLRHAGAVVGNSSSGILEAASFRLPVVDVGDRQAGRIAPANVIRVPAEAGAVAAAWRRALSPAFRSELEGLVNPYGDGQAVPRIIARLKTVELGPKLLAKAFHDPAAHTPATA